MFQEDEEKYKIYKSYSEKLIKILTNAKDKMKNYYKTIVYLTSKDLDSINKGKHTNITILQKEVKKIYQLFFTLQRNKFHNI